MSEFLSKFRAKYPEYDSIGDVKLVKALNAKYNAESGTQLAEDEFYSQIGYTPTPTVSIEPPQAINADGSPMIGVDTTQTSPVFNQPQDLLPQPDIALEQNAMQIGGHANIDPMASVPQMGGVDSTPTAPVQTPEGYGTVLRGYGRGEAPELSLLEKAQNIAAKIGERSATVSSNLLDASAKLDAFTMGESPRELAYLDKLKGYSKDLKKVDLGYQEQKNWEDLKKSFSKNGALSGTAWADVLEYGIEQGLGSTPDMAATILSMPAYIASRSNEIGDIRAKNDGRETGDLKDMLIAAPFATASAFLEKIGVKGMGKAAMETIGKGMLKSGFKAAIARTGKAAGKGFIAEGVPEFFQEGMIEYAGENFGTEAAMSWKEALDRGAGALVAGGTFGTVTGGAGAAISETSKSTKNAKLNRKIDDLSTKIIDSATPTISAEQQALNAMKPPLKVVEKAPEKVEEVEAVEEEVKPETPKVETQTQAPKTDSKNLKTEEYYDPDGPDILAMKKPEKLKEYDEKGNITLEARAKFVENSEVKDPVYHGTDAVFEHFDTEKIGQNFGDERGFYFSSSQADAMESGGILMSAHLSIENPLTVEMEGDPISNFDVDKLDLFDQADYGGHDGIIVNEIGGEKRKMYVAFSPDQIKIAKVKPTTKQAPKQTQTQAPKTDSKNLKTEEYYDPDGPDILAMKKPESNELGDISKALSKKGIKNAIRENDSSITIDKIIVPEDSRGQGVGTKAMSDIIKYADSKNKTIALSPSVDFGGKSLSAVNNFYKNLGFIPNKGKNKDFEISESMIKIPKPQPTILKSKRPTPSNFETVKTLTSKATRRKDIRVYKGDKNTYDPLSASITLREDATAEQGKEIAQKTKEKDGDWKGEEIELTFKDEAKQTYKDTVNAGEIMAEYKEQSRLIKAVKDCLE